MNDRRHIQEAIEADKGLDESLARYAEFDAPSALAESLDRATRVYAALKAEAKRIHRTDLINIQSPTLRNRNVR